MGQAQSTAGRQLLSVVEENNTRAAAQILAEHPGAACYATCIDRNSPLLLAAGRGHARMVQAILEAAVISQGLSRAKKRCINHSNSKGQSALMLACIHGHAQCAEVLVQNGASPLVLDNSRHNSALHWAASCCRADCVGRLLGSGAMFQMQSGQLVAIAEIPCFDEDNATLVKFVDRHNGWGLTALHLATYKGSSSTVRALLRHGASLSARTTAPTLSNSPMLHPPGSTALHFAATAEDMSLVLVLLEAQVSRNDPDMRRATNANGQRPIDVAPSSISANPLLLQLLDPSHALSLHPGPRTGIVLNPGSSMSRVVTREGLRHHQALLGLSSGSGFRGSRRALGAADGQPPHVALGALLQRLKLVLSLEAFALQQQLAAAAAAAASSNGGSAAAVAGLLAQKVKQQQVDAAAAGGEEGESGWDDVIGTAPAADTAPFSAAAAGGISSDAPETGPLHVARTASSGLSSTVLEISPGSSSGDDTRAFPDAQQQQQQSAAQAAAQQVRLKQLQHMAAAVDELLALLPASATATPASPSASGSTSPRQQHQQGGAAGRHSSSSTGPASWGLLGGLLARNSTGSPDQHLGTMQQQQQQQQQQASAGRRRSGRSRRSSTDGTGTGTGSDSSPASAPLSEEVLAAYITASMLSSLAAVTKLFVGASSLSGQQQQQQQQQASEGGSHARWADQEHALLLMKGVIKTLRTTLEAAQQAAAAAASRSALRQRHQQQLASLLGSDSRPAHSHSLRRALLGERLLLEQGRIRFGSSSTAGTAGGSSSSRHDGSMAAAYLGSMGMSLGGLDAPLSVSSLPAGGGSGGGRHHSSRRHHHRDRARRLRGEDGGSDGGQQEGRRHRRHHSRHASRSGRRRTPRAVDLPMHDLLPAADVPSSRQHARDTEAPAAGRSDTASRSSGFPPQEEHAAAAATAEAGGPASSLTHTSQRQQDPLQQQQQQQQQPLVTSSSRAVQDGGDEIQPSPAAEAAASSGAGAAAASQQAVSLHSAGSSTSLSSSNSSRRSALADDHHDDDALAVDESTRLSSDSEEGPGLDGSLCSSLDATTCAICMDCTAGVSVSRCSHSLCLQCAYQLCCKAKGLPLCPFCRQPIDGFGVAAAAAASGGS